LSRGISADSRLALFLTLRRRVAILRTVVVNVLLGIRKLIPNRIGWPVLALNRALESFQRRKLLWEWFSQFVGMSLVGVKACQKLFLS
jgi:hypothetical protein